jgi:hypothetical protein
MRRRRRIFGEKKLNKNYLITFTLFPLHNDRNPSSFIQRVKHSGILLYGVLSFKFSVSVYINNFTRSIGAATVLDIAPATPPDKKSNKNLLYYPSYLFYCFIFYYF